ncbi:MAG: hypothetical protein J1G01_00960 [Clostridiales bacterium]|nr:hypothetical protein [Clostridiales bacterium]
MKERKNILTLDGKTFLSAPIIDTSIDLCVFDIGGQFEKVKAKLIKLYGDIEVTADGVAANLCTLKCGDVIEICAQPEFSKKRYNAADAMRVTARLTREGDGCPWDRAQTHDSIRINMIEEAYEAVDAIDKRDLPNMCEEFGDVLLQSLLHSDISRRTGEFDFDDVCDGLCKKLIGRHTFIFGSDSAGSADDALSLWEKNKGIEKHYDTVKSQLQKLPENFPSLLLCQKTHKKLKKAGEYVNPQADLESALNSGDYAKAIAACAALLSDSGKDAEVELNKLVKQKIESL